MRSVALHGSGTNAILASRATAQAVKIAEGLRFAALDELLTQMRGATIPGDVQQHFIDLLTERAKGLINAAADATANEALALGRHDEAMFFAEDIEVVTFTSLLDRRTCFSCAQADGVECRMGDATFERLSPPYRECEGGMRCRCQFVFTLKTEAPGAGLTTGDARHLRARRARGSR